MPGAEARIQLALRGFRALSNDPARSGFGVVAAEFSDDGNTRYQGGDLGWLTPDQLAARLPLEAKRQIDSLPPGQASETIQLADGFCIVLATGERPAVPISENDLRELVKYEMINRRRGEARVNFLRKSREGIKVEIYGEKYTAARVGPDSKQSTRPPEP